MATEAQTVIGEANGRSGVTVGSKPWLKSYQGGVPERVAYEAQTLPELFDSAVKRYARQTAAAYFGATLTYRDLDRLSAQFANRLLTFGLQQGDRVLVILPNVPQFLIAHFGILRAGGVVCALSPLLVEREIEALTRDAGAKTVVVFNSFYEKVAGLRERGVVDRVIVASPDEFLPLIKRLLYPLVAEGPPPAVPDDPRGGVYRFRRLLRGADDRPRR